MCYALVPTMKVHHLNCATMCPRGARLLGGDGGFFDHARMVCHCLLVETNDGLVLVDSGLGLGDVADPAGRLGRAFAFATHPRLDPEETAVRQVERLGYDPRDLRHVVLTHLDLDHAGALPDLPWAKVHVFEPEHAAAMRPRTLLERERYRACQWAHGPAWVTHAVDGERWEGFACVRPLPGVEPAVLLVPLPGHTRGHCAVAVQTGGSWLLHCGDAYFFRGEMHPEKPRCPPGFAFFQSLVEIDRAARLANQRRLRELGRDRAGAVRLFCAHDPAEYESLSAGA